MRRLAVSKSTLTTSHGATKPNALVNSASTPTLTSPPDPGPPLPAWMQPLSVLGSTRNGIEPGKAAHPNTGRAASNTASTVHRIVEYMVSGKAVTKSERAHCPYLGLA